MSTSKLKTLSTFLLVILLLFLCESMYARAGGGGRNGGGGGGMVISIIGVICLAIFYAVLFFKTRKSNSILKRAYKEDPIWEAEEMKNFAEDVFFQMQAAWMSRNMNRVKGIVSKNLYENYRERLAVMKANHEKNILERIDVSDIKIIGCEDYQNNNKDTFVAYIKGTMIDYTMCEKTKNIINNKHKQGDSFADTYHFIRRGDTWILDQINNDSTILGILIAPNHKE